MGLAGDKSPWSIKFEGFPWQNRKIKERKDRVFYSHKACNGQIVGQARKWECRQNVRKNVEKMSKNCPEGLKHNFRTFF